MTQDAESPKIMIPLARPANGGTSPPTSIMPPDAVHVSATLPYAPPPHQSPWKGFWIATLVMVLCLGIHFVVGTVIAVGYIMYYAALGAMDEMDSAVEGLMHNGMFLAVTTIVISVLTVGFLQLVLLLRKLRWREYLAVRLPSRRAAALWMLALGAFLVAQEAWTTYFVEDTKTAAFMANIINSAGPMPLFLLGVVVAAPFAEEWLFRGFMFTAYARSPVGVIGAIAIPAFIWAMIHMQYDWGYIGVIFAMGLLLGAARWSSGSLILPIVMHMTVNLLATLQAMYDIHLFEK